MFLFYFLVNFFFKCNTHSEQCTIRKCTGQGIFTKWVCRHNPRPCQEEINTSILGALHTPTSNYPSPPTPRLTLSWLLTPGWGNFPYPSCSTFSQIPPPALMPAPTTATHTPSELMVLGENGSEMILLSGRPLGFVYFHCFTVFTQQFIYLCHWLGLFLKFYCYKQYCNKHPCM